MSLLTIIIVICIVFVIVVFKYFGSKKSEKITEKGPVIYKYTRKDYLMSRAEHNFFNLLTEITGNNYYIFPQIHLSTMLDNKVKGQNWKAAFKHINEKSVDFVICDKTYIKPLVAIELDDWSHEAEDRRQRDIDVENIFEGAGLPLLRFKNVSNLSKEEIDQRLKKVLLSKQSV